MDLASKQLDNCSHLSSENSLLKSAMEGKDHIPLDAMTKFIRLAHIYEQKDILELLGERVIEETQSSSNEIIVSRGKALQLMLAMELLVNAHRRYMLAAQGNVPATSKRAASGMQGGRGGKVEGESATVVKGVKGESGRSSASQGKRKGEAGGGGGGGGRVASPSPGGRGAKKDSGGKGGRAASPKSGRKADSGGRDSPSQEAKGSNWSKKACCSWEESGGKEGGAEAEGPGKEDPPPAPPPSKLIVNSKLQNT